MLPPAYSVVASDGQPLIVPSASMPRLFWPALQPVQWTRSSPQVLVRAEVADVVAGLHEEAAVDALLVEFGEQGHQFEQLVGLQKEFRVVCGPAHRHGELNLPVPGAGLDEEVHQLAELRDDQRRDLRVDARSQAVFAE